MEHLCPWCFLCFLERERLRELFSLLLLDDFLDFLGELGRLSLSDCFDRVLLSDERDDFLVRDDLLLRSLLLLEIGSFDSDFRRLNSVHSFPFVVIFCSFDSTRILF
ncbi:hypothetical protein Y032_0039g25 [Ancylostoma ceylanicum]|uniref:Uncharacterized protein n=1 Tax=Ancylostoma ceylanicum TaxID=53326 RepID=A0A016UJU3_9BILA|nr:hypothetical protein Y032_0039g25 [Ancylostoma ceylanicum]